MTADEKSELFWDIAKPMLLEGTAQKSTMMGFPCLRTAEGAFFASLEKESADMIIKAPAERVKELIASGVAQPFAPNGRTFKEWAKIVPVDRELWFDLIQEAYHFVNK